MPREGSARQKPEPRHRLKAVTVHKATSAKSTVSRVRLAVDLVLMYVGRGQGVAVSVEMTAKPGAQQHMCS